MSGGEADVEATARSRLGAVAEWMAAVLLVGWVAFGCTELARWATSFREGPRCGLPILAVGFWLTPAAVLLAPLLLRWWRAERRGTARSAVQRTRLVIGALAWVAAALLAGVVWSLLVLEVLVA